MSTSPIDVADVLVRFPGATYLSQGGQKVVLSTVDALLGPVVLKVGTYPSRNVLERIQREVDTLRGITSDFFPECFSFELLPGDRFLIVEQRLEGETLEHLIATYGDPDAALNLLRDIATGLRLLWDRNIVHRDIKPANLIVTPQGRGRIIDLGIARLLDLNSLTQSAAPFGPCTPAYASPEQLRNDKYSIDRRTDQYSLGIVFGQLAMRGQHPFEPTVVGGASIPENILNDQWAKAQLQALLPAEHFQLLEKMLKPYPHQRLRTPDKLIGRMDFLLGA